MGGLEEVLGQINIQRVGLEAEDPFYGEDGQIMPAEKARKTATEKLRRVYDSTDSYAGKLAIVKTLGMYRQLEEAGINIDDAYAEINDGIQELAIRYQSLDKSVKKNAKKELLCILKHHEDVSARKSVYQALGRSEWLFQKREWAARNGDILFAAAVIGITSAIGCAIYYFSQLYSK